MNGARNWRGAASSRWAKNCTPRRRAQRWPSALPFSPGQRFGGQLKPFIEHIGQMRTMNDAVIVVSRQASRLAELWAERDHLRPPVHSVLDRPEPRALIFVQGLLDEGWTLRGITPRDEGERRSVGLWSLHVITDAEIFGWSRPQPRRRGKPKAITPEQFFADLQPGDYVVHIDHGIGVFQGLITLTLEGVEREYLQVAVCRRRQAVRPDPSGRSAEQIHRGGRSRAGRCIAWARPIGSQVRSKAQRRPPLAEVAANCWNCTPRANSSPGYAFSARHAVAATNWKRRSPTWRPKINCAPFAKSRADMQKPRPMDRLICGDVGYGKTEVALRAAFKAVQDGKQVAVLVPTTVLAQQHFGTFQSRLAPFPVNGRDAQSRFRSHKEQDAILQAPARGQGGHCHRHAPPAAKGRAVQRPGPAHH